MESTKELKFKDETERVLATLTGKENQSLEELHGQVIQDEQQKLITASTQEAITKQIKGAIDRETVTAKVQLIVPMAHNLKSLEQTSEVSGNKEHQSCSLESKSLEIAKKEILELKELLQNQLRIAKEQEEPHSWVIYKEEVELTEEVLGRGGYGEVKVAIFRGIRVAAKVLYQIILSVYNQELFTREMTIAAKIRHPNLLLFIGATREGEAIILTELMPTSLQKELERGDMQRKETISIAQDVACALRYLHQWRPSPIIHRDISSANVLLEPLPNGWRAKVSDYGSANFMNSIKTATPGSPAYAAPEARYPDQHSPKMDTFSYGVLLTEMCNRRFPEPNSMEREVQTLQIQWAAMASLVRRCTSERPADRPSMRDIMELLASNKLMVDD